MKNRNPPYWGFTGEFADIDILKRMVVKHVKEFMAEQKAKPRDGVVIVPKEPSSFPTVTVSDMKDGWFSADVRWPLMIYEIEVVRRW